MAERRKRLNKRTIILVSVLGFVLILGLFSNFLVSNIATKKVNAYLQNDSSILYNISLQQINVNLFSGSITIDAVNVQPRLYQIHDSIPGMYTGQISRVEVNNFGYLKYLLKGKVDIKLVNLENMQLSYSPNPWHVKAKNKKKTKKVKHVLGPKLPEIVIHKISISSATYAMVNATSKQDTSVLVKQFSVVIDELVADSSTLKNDPPLHFKDLNIQVAGMQYSKSPKYLLKADEIAYKASTQMLECNGFSLKPKYNRKQFSKVLKHEDDMFDISLDSLTAEGLDIVELFSEKHLLLSQVTMRSPQIEIYRDKRVVDGPFKHKPLVTSMVKKIPIPIKIQEISIEGGRLSYEEKQENQNPPGMVFFDLQEITFSNLSNLTSEIHINPIMKMNFKSKLMGKGVLNAHFDFKLNCVNDSFIVNGTLGQMPAAAFNPMVENLLNVKLTKGTVKNATFNFEGTDNESSGKLHLDYSNLQMDIKSESRQQRGVMSFAANRLVNTSNLPNERNYRVGYIHFERDKNKGVPNFLWKSVLSGIKPIVVPISSSKEQRDMQKLTDAK